MKKILIIGGLPSSLVAFRGPLLKALISAGHKVSTAANGRAPDTETKLRALGVEYIPIRVARAGLNPVSDLITLFDLIRAIRCLKPDVVVSYTVKPVIWGGLAARFCRIGEFYSIVTGLGYAFMEATSLRQRLVGWLVRSLYSLSLRYSGRVFFQNPDDEQAFTAMGLVSKEKTVVVSGSGVDLAAFPFAELKQESHMGPSPIRFLLIARLLKDKGINEYAQAARIIKKEYPQAEFHLIGPFDPNPARLEPKDIRAWEDAGLIKFHGEQSDVRPFIRDCHVYVLPSYREGTPRTVLEAMAMGRAVITTDTPGCRETIGLAGTGPGQTIREDAGELKVGRNGILVPIKNVKALAAAMSFFFKHPGEIASMGRESRCYAEDRYAVHKVNAVLLREMKLDEIFSEPGAG